MRLVFVTPAWRRPGVTRVALAQRAHLHGVLAGQGIHASTVVIADDTNLDIAAGFGFDTLERENVLGAKLNDGIQWALDRDADWVCFAGSDNWLHPELFDRLADRRTDEIVAGRLLAVIDLQNDRGMVCRVHGRKGTAPWLIPANLLTPRPVPDDAASGMEMLLAVGMGNPRFVFDDPHLYARVDFTTDVNMTAYESFEHLRVTGTHDPWEDLAAEYPADIVEMARDTERVFA